MIVCPCLLFDFLWSVWCNPNSPHTVLFACGINEHGDPYSRHRLGGRDRENEHVPFLWSKKLNHVSICLRSHDCQRACAEVELQLRVDTRVAQLISPSYFRIRPAHCPTSLHCALLFILTGPLSPCKTRAVVEREIVAVGERFAVAERESCSDISEYAYDDCNMGDDEGMWVRRQVVRRLTNLKVKRFVLHMCSIYYWSRDWL